jgi:hypothetical protein
MYAAVATALFLSAAPEPIANVDLPDLGLLGILNGRLAERVATKDNTRAADALATRTGGATASPLATRGATTTHEIIAAAATPTLVLPNVIISPDIYNPAAASAAAAKAWERAPRLESSEVAALESQFTAIHEEIEGCYEWPLNTRNKQTETVVTSVLVAPNGKVLQARVQRRAGESISTMEPCMRDALMGLRFPAGLRSVAAEVRYPWTFVTPGDR